MSALPLISVILPVHNAAATVRAAVDSLDAESVSQVEVVAVDDGSTDASAALLDDMAQTRPWLRVLHAPHRGIAPALNAGIGVARGELIARMDADDRSLPGRLERQRRFLLDHHSIGLVSGRVRFGGDPHRARGYAHYVSWINSLRDPADIAAMRFVESPFAHPAVMFRANLVRLHGGYRDGAFPEDYELWLRWMDQGVRMASIPDEVLLWSDPPDRLSRTDARYSIDAFYMMKAEYIARWAVRRVRSWPQVYFWGAGRTTRKRAQYLIAHGAQVRAWVDIDVKKIGHRVWGAPVIAAEELPPPGECFIFPFVGSRSARADIMRWLEERGYVLERDYVPVA